MSDGFDDEVNAIKAVLKALETLSPDARKSVIEYVTKRLGIAVKDAVEVVPPSVRHALETSGPQPATPVHIKAFKEQKNPRSANEMAAVVAYYLAELAPADKRKKRVNSSDIETYFKIAEYPLPDVRFTLSNAKQAGYLNAIGEGEYELNAVGHNLVAHSLPRTGAGGASTKKGKKSNRSQKRG